MVWGAVAVPEPPSLDVEIDLCIDLARSGDRKLGKAVAALLLARTDVRVAVQQLSGAQHDLTAAIRRLHRQLTAS